MDFLFFQKSYLCYKFKAKDEYSLHSPFMFDFFVNGLKTSCKNSEIIFVPELEKRIPKAKSLRKFLFKTFRYLKSKEMELLYIDSESFVKENLEHRRRIFHCGWHRNSGQRNRYGSWGTPQRGCP